MPDGNSDISVLSVLKNNHARGVGISRGCFFGTRKLFLARRAAEIMELRIFDAEERGGKQRAYGLRRNRERRQVPFHPPSRRDAPLYQNVPDGNSP